MIAQSIKENQHLARIGMVTFLGDFISLFAILLLLEKSGFGPEYAGISIVFQAAAYALSALSYPYLSSKFNTKQLIILSQLFSLFFACIILIMYLIVRFHRFDHPNFTKFDHPMRWLADRRDAA